MQEDENTSFGFTALVSFIHSQEVGGRSWCTGNCFHDRMGHSLPARTGLNGLTLHHNKPFANKHANQTNKPSKSCQYVTVLLINWVLNKLHLLALALIAASSMQYKLISLSASLTWTILMAKAAEDQTLMLIKYPSLNQMIELATDVIKIVKKSFLWEGELINRLGC